MNIERMARIFKWWKRADRKVSFYEEESRQKQREIDPWNVRHINHPDNVGSEDWCKWNQWSMRREILQAKLENRPANHWYNCGISNAECERRNGLARERFDAKVAASKLVIELPMPGTLEGYHIDEAYLEDCNTKDTYDSDDLYLSVHELIEVLAKAGISYKFPDGIKVVTSGL